jgi:hypothetical protein
VKAELDQWLTRVAITPSSLSPTFAEASALASVAGRLDPRDWSLVEKLLVKLDHLRQVFPDKPEIAAQWALAMLNVLINCYYLERTDEVRQLLNKIGEVYHSFPQEVFLAELRASALTTALASYIAAGEMQEIEVLLKELRYLHRVFEANSQIRELLAKGIVNVIGGLGLRQQLEKVPGLLREVQKLLPETGEDDSVAEQIAIAVSNAIKGYCGVQQMDEVEQLLGELHDLEERFPEATRIKNVRAMALAMALAAYGNIGQMDSVENILDYLRHMKPSSHSRESIANWMAEGLKNAIIGYTNSQQIAKPARRERANEHLDELRTLSRTFPTRDDITDHLATAIAWVIAVYANTFSDDFESLLGEVRMMYQNRPERWLASAFALAVMHAVLGYINLDMWEKVDSLRAEMLELSNTFPGLTMGQPRPSPNRVLMSNNPLLS